MSGTFGDSGWGGDLWGGPGAAQQTVSDYAPFVIYSYNNDSSFTTLSIPVGSLIDIAFDVKAVINQGVSEAITATSWVSSDGNLTVLAFAVSGNNRSVVRLQNQLSPGDSAIVTCSIGTSTGRVIVRSVLVSSTPIF